MASQRASKSFWHTLYISFFLGHISCPCCQPASEGLHSSSPNKGLFITLLANQWPIPPWGLSRINYTELAAIHLCECTSHSELDHLPWGGLLALTDPNQSSQWFGSSCQICMKSHVYHGVKKTTPDESKKMHCKNNEWLCYHECYVHYRLEIESKWPSKMCKI